MRMHYYEKYLLRIILLFYEVFFPIIYNNYNFNVIIYFFFNIIFYNNFQF